MRINWIICASIFLAHGSLVGAADSVKVFVLAGQSNMEGKAKNSLLDYQATAPQTRELFAHLRDGDQWIEREDVLVKFLERKGKLTVGYGSPQRTGVELEFGTVMGDHFDEPVLLIKTAWGGHSLFKLFRSPSAGMPSDEVLAEELEKARQRVIKNNEKRKQNEPLPTMDDVTVKYGESYRNMLAEVRNVFENYETMFPSLAGRELQMTGFVWFQGWNDQYGAEDHYGSNLQHLIDDVRKDFDAPNLPFVIGVMGQNGSKPAKGAMQKIQQAQLAMESLPGFQGNVKAVRTDVLVDKAAEALYPNWRENLEQWERTGSDHPYHYLGSAIWFNRIGREMANEMIKMIDVQ